MARARRHHSLTCLPRSAHVSSSQPVDRPQYAKHTGSDLVLSRAVTDQRSRVRTLPKTSCSRGPTAFHSPVVSCGILIQSLLKSPFQCCPIVCKPIMLAQLPYRSIRLCVQTRLASFLPPAFYGISHLCRPLLFKKTVARIFARDIHPRRSYCRAPRRSIER